MPQAAFLQGEQLTGAAKRRRPEQALRAQELPPAICAPKKLTVVHEEPLPCPELPGMLRELGTVAQVIKAMELVGQKPEAVTGVDKPGLSPPSVLPIYDEVITTCSSSLPGMLAATISHLN